MIKTMILAFCFFACSISSVTCTSSSQNTTVVDSHILIALKQQNTDILLDAFHNVSNPESPLYGKYWTHTQINDLVAPPQDQIDDLLTYMKKQKLDCKFKGSDALECNSVDNYSLAQLSNPNLFKIVDFIEIIKQRLNTDRKTSKIMNNNIKTTNVNTPKVRTTRVNHHLELATRKHNLLAHSVGDGDGYVGREVLIPFYNITYNKVSNSRTSVCAVEYQDIGGISNTDLTTQQSLNGQPQKPITHIVGVNQSPMMEAQLDVQMMSQIAQGSDVWMWSGDRWLYSFAVNFLNRSTVPDILSMSWGWSARDQCAAGLGLCPGNMTSAQYVHRVNTEYVKMGLRGVTVTVSSGDAGAAGRTNEACAYPNGGGGSNVDPVNPAFPGSSPYITSVSATFIVPQQPIADNVWETPVCKQDGCVNGTHELPCNFNFTGWTTGGGFAVYNESRPTWQNSAVEHYLKSNAKRPTRFQKNGRGYPDVAAVGHNCPTVMNGQVMGVDGTSCTSPIVAALLALLNDYQVAKGKPKLGFANPVLYKMWTDNPMTFNDITKGNNWCTEMQCCNSSFGYESAVGWDPVTGLGTPNFGLMVEWLDSHT